MRRVLLITIAGALLTIVSPSVRAQRMGGGAHFGSGHGFHFGAANFGRHFGSLADSLAFFGDPFYGDALYDSGYPVASQPPVIIVQGASAAAKPPATASPTQPLMIELRGDRYVRVSGDENSGVEMIDGDAAPIRPQGGSVAASHAAPVLPPAILVFRDGHREEVSGYTITDGALYASGDFYTAGSWTRKIELSALNLPETIRASQSNGVQFELPGAPNEVIVRP
jgi:hypothetical protein